jgi:hypothetical protein
MKNELKKTPEQRLKAHRRFMVVVMALAGMILIGVYLRYYLSFGGDLSTAQESWGAFGDYVGGVLNPLLAFLALFALLYTIVLQVEELQEMRTEFTKTVDAAKHQTFEATFFQLLRLHNENVAIISLEEDKPDPSTMRKRKYVHRGKTALYHYTKLVEQEIEKHPVEPDAASEVRANVIATGYRAFFGHFGPVLGNYFDTIYEILSFVDRCELDVDKLAYSRIIRSQLASWEALLIAYYCLSSQRLSWSLNELVNRYSLLETLDAGGLNRVKNFECFEPEPFGPNGLS